MGDWGKRIKLIFDKPVHHLYSSEAITKFRINDLGGFYKYPKAVTYGSSQSRFQKYMLKLQRSSKR